MLYLNILVYNPAALYGGAANILNSFIEDIEKDDNNKYFIVISKYIGKTYSNYKGKVHFIEISHNYFYRFYWLYFKIYKIIKKYDINAMISLENTCNIFLRKIPQYIYIQQSLQFASLKNLSLKLFIKIKIINNLLMYFSCKRASKIFVQTNWMKKAVGEKYKISEYKIDVIRSKTYKGNPGPIQYDIINRIYKLREEGNYIGLCVTGAEKYKNIEILIEFVYQANKFHNLNVILLLTIEQNPRGYAGKLQRLVKRYALEKQVLFIGTHSGETIETLYKIANALFYSSSIETVGLPLIEAMKHKLRIFAPDLPYAREVCGEYAFLYKFDDGYSLLQVFLKFLSSTPKESKEKYRGDSFMNMIDKIAFL